MFFTVYRNFCFYKCYVYFSFLIFSANVRDYILLYILFVICKPSDKVKIGKKLLKSSVEETREAFSQKIVVNKTFFICSIILLLLLLCCN